MPKCTVYGRNSSKDELYCNVRYLVTNYRLQDSKMASTAVYSNGTIVLIIIRWNGVLQCTVKISHQDNKMEWCCSVPYT